MPILRVLCVLSALAEAFGEYFSFLAICRTSISVFGLAGLGPLFFGLRILDTVGMDTPASIAMSCKVVKKASLVTQAVTLMFYI